MYDNSVFKQLFNLRTLEKLILRKSRLLFQLTTNIKFELITFDLKAKF